MEEILDNSQENITTNEVKNNFIINEPHEFYDEIWDFTTLDTWIKCREVKLFFYNKVIIHLPPEEKYNLEFQIRKASVSSTSNIAEGYGRYHYQEGIQFYRISRGSLYELKDHLISCYDFNYIKKELKDEGEKLIETAKVILNGYINFLKNKIEQTKR